MARLGLAVPCLFAAAAVAILALAPGAASQAPAPAPTPTADCSSAVTALAGCLTYVLEGSAQGKPTKDCCAGVKGALKSPATIACLCAALGGSGSYPVKVNLTRAATLPEACGENPAALSTCNIKMPGSPTEGPAPSSGSSPAANSPGESKSAAARSPVSAFATVAALAAPLLVFYYL